MAGEISAASGTSAPQLLEADELELWDTARVTEAAAASGCRCIFGYGSLMWKVGFPYEHHFPCSIEGPFARRFWMRSADHRGTSEFPGRVATLVQLPDEDDNGEGGVSRIPGVAYVVPVSELGAVLASLDYRERHGYTRDVCTVIARDGSRSEAFCYYYARPQLSDSDDVLQGSAMVWGESLEQTAAVIAKACGPSGSNLEYLQQAVACVRSLGARDEYLDSLLALSEQLADTGDRKDNGDVGSSQWQDRAFAQSEPIVVQG